MPPKHLAGTAQALYRVFIAPSIASPSAPRAAIRLSPALAEVRPATSQLRTFTKRASGTAVPGRAKPATTQYPVDGAIKSDHINLVTEEGFQRDVPTKDVLRTVNRATHHLVQVAPANANDPFSLPTCKVISKIDLRAQEAKRVEVEKAQKKAAKGAGSKALEINWGIGQNDLAHYMKRLREFLAQGRRVDVVLMRKPRKKMADLSECRDLVRAVREEVQSMDGIKEWKAEEGKVGGTLIMYFEGPKGKGK